MKNVVSPCRFVLDVLKLVQLMCVSMNDFNFRMVRHVAAGGGAPPVAGGDQGRTRVIELQGGGQPEAAHHLDQVCCIFIIILK